MSSSFADGLFWLSVACCALAQYFILRSVGASRRVPAGTMSLTRQRGMMEMVWAVLPAVGLAVLLVFTWRAVRTTAQPAAQRVQAPVQRVGVAP
jgi:heme/copper-type cytochrome/quinol oxidase subunit 2